MKKSLFLTVLVTIATYCYTQVDTISTNIYQNNGFLGIGTTNPSTALEIIDSVNSGDGRYLMNLYNPSLGAYSTCGLKLMAGSGDEFGAINFTSETFNDPNQVDAANSLFLGTNAKSIGLQVNQPDGYIKFSTGGLSKCYPAFERMRIDGNGNIGIGTTAPLEKLDINGGLRIGNTENTNSGSIRWTGSDFEGYNGENWLSFTSGLGENYWNSNGSNISYTSGNVGIGTSTPNVKLRIEGNVDNGPERALLRLKNLSTGNNSSVSVGLESNNSLYGLALTLTSEQYTGISDFDKMGVISVNGKGFSIYSTSDYGSLRFYTNMDQKGIIERMRITADGEIGIGTKEPIEKLDVSGGIRLGFTENTNSGSIRWTGSDFEGYNGENWLSFTSGSGKNYWNANGNDLYYTGGRVGIGTDVPENALSIRGNEDEWPGRIFISVKNTSTSGKSLSYIKLQAGPTASGTSLGHISSTYTSCDNYEEVADFGRLTSSGNGIMIDATKPDMSAGIIKFCSGQGPGTAFIERMRVNADGNIGIGTSSPSAKLQIADGDIYISDIDKGIIMKSPDGQCWRGTVDNTGSLNFVLIQCPEEPVGIEVDGNDDNSGIVQVFPNPSGNSVSILIKGDDTKKVLKLYSTAGVLILSKALDSNLSEIDISNYMSGIFLFNIEDNDGNFISSVKVIKR